MQKKALIICRHFLPYCASYGWIARIFKLAIFLKNAGHEVFVLSSRGVGPVDFFGYEKELKEINCTYVLDKLGEREDRVTDDFKITEECPKENGFFRKTLELLKSLIIEFSVPDLGVYFLNRYYKEAIGLIEKNGISNVIISSPRHSMQLIGPRLKKRYGNKINIIVDYRDSWNGRQRFRKKFIFLQKLNKLLEKSVLSSADHFTYVSDPILNKIKKGYGAIVDNKAHLIMNGFDESIFNETISIGSKKAKEPGLIRIGYFGNFYEYMNPYRFLQALDKTVKMTGTNKIVKVFTYGEITNNLYWKIKSDFSGLVVVQGKISHKESIRLMLDMDYLLIVDSEESDADEVVTGKFFDYISTKKPIIVAGPNDMEVARLVNAYKLGITMDSDNEEEMIERLKKLISQELNKDAFYLGFDIGRFSRENQFKRFLDLLI